MIQPNAKVRLFARGGKVFAQSVPDDTAQLAETHFPVTELVFGADTEHVQSSPFEIGNDSNIIERFQGTIRDRTKVVRGYKTLPTARVIIDGFMVHYNFFRPHIGLNGKTPAEVAGIRLPSQFDFELDWSDVPERRFDV